MPVEQKLGVGVLLVKRKTPYSFVCGSERTASESSHKIEGQRSAIFETLQEGEDMLQAIRRATGQTYQVEGQSVKGEEIEITKGRIHLPQTAEALEAQAKLCTVQLSESALLHGYLLYVSDNFRFKNGSTEDEFNRAGWARFDDVRCASMGMDPLKYRPGNYELVSQAFEKLRHADTFEVKHFDQLKNPIDPEVFRLMSLGISQNTALSRLNLAAPQPSVVGRVVDRLGLRRSS